MKYFFLLVILCSWNGFAQCPYYLTITTQEQIDNFAETYPNCTGSAMFLDINPENSTITNLEGLSQLTSLVRLGIFFTNVTNFSGLENITDIYGKLLILGNSDLIDFTGFESLQNVGDRFRIVLNDELTTLQGLNSLTELGGNLEIEVNGNLQSLSGLNNLTRIGGTFEILSHPNLSSLNGLESLQEIGSVATDEFYLYNNPLIETLGGLENLSLINGTLQIRNNSSLSSISALSALETVTTGIDFRSNAQLSNCAIDLICNNLENSNIELIFENNDVGCSSFLEVQASCLLSAGTVEISGDLFVFPNPVSEKLLIRTSEGIVLQKVTVFSILGEELISTSDLSSEASAKEEESMDLSNLSAGIYFVNITTDQGSVTRKIVKE